MKENPLLEKSLCFAARIVKLLNFLLKSEPQRFRTSTGSFIFARFYAAFLTALIKYLFGLKNQNRIKTKSKNVK